MAEEKRVRQNGHSQKSEERQLFEVIMDIRCRYREMTEYLKTKFSRLEIQPENFGHKIVTFEAEPGGLNVTESGLHYANFRYRSVFYFERLPQKHLALLVLLVQNWLDRFDDTRREAKLDRPKFEVISLDDGTHVNVDAAVDFLDPANLVETPGGQLVIFGKEYDAGSYDLWIAETLEEIDEHVANPA